MVKLSKKLINEKLVPHLSKGKRGPKCKFGLWRIIQAILYKLKSGSQWREPPLREFFGRFSISWNTVYYYFQKWSKDGSWYRLWTAFLKTFFLFFIVLFLTLFLFDYFDKDIEENIVLLIKKNILGSIIIALLVTIVQIVGLKKFSKEESTEDE